MRRTFLPHSGSSFAHRLTTPCLSYRCLRRISYREFSCMVYGVLGAKRISLPACAYTTIRKKFPVGKDEEYEGFEMDDDDES